MARPVWQKVVTTPFADEKKFHKVEQHQASCLRSYIGPACSSNMLTRQCFMTSGKDRQHEAKVRNFPPYRATDFPRCEMSLMAHRVISRQRSKRSLLGASRRCDLLGNYNFLASSGVRQTSSQGYPRLQASP